MHPAAARLYLTKLASLNMHMPMLRPFATTRSILSPPRSPFPTHTPTSTIHRPHPTPPAARGRALQELLDSKEEDREDADDGDALPAVTSIQWASPLKIIPYPDPRLRAPNAPVACFDDTLKQLASEMMELMYADDGVGLAAPQVGVNIRMMVFNETGDRKRKDCEVVLINPRVISSSKDAKVFEEGCLSFPNIYGDVIRPSKVRVKAQDLTGKKFVINISGFPARVFQHEYDHLQSVLYCDRMAPGVLSKIYPEFLKMEEDFIQENPESAPDVQRLQPPPPPQ